MIPSAPSHLTRTLAAGVGLAATLTFTASCSSPAREYAVPTDLCGVKIVAAVLEPVLPPGKEASLHPTAAGGNKRCRLHVDGKAVLSASIEPWEKDTSAQDVARGALAVGPLDTPSKDHRYIYSKTGAVGRVNCPIPQNSNRSVWATVRVTHNDATNTDMKSLITAYTDAVAASGECSEVMG